MKVDYELLRGGELPLDWAEAIDWLKQAADDNARLREALTRCGELFSEIRSDWSDPRSECREGFDIIETALSPQTNKEQSE